MALPVLFAVDGDPDALGDAEAQLVARYGHDYRVESAGDPENALRALAELADAGVEVAPVLAVASAVGEGSVAVRLVHTLFADEPARARRGSAAVS